MRTIALTRGYVATVDDADYERLAAHRWYAHPGSRAVYAARRALDGGRSRVVFMHRMLLDVPAGFEVDHRDGDGLNNRRANLRLATRAQNNRNARLRRDNASGYKGVSYRPGQRGTRKWRARIKAHGRSQHLGWFATPEEAHAAYRVASAALHGEFGRVE